MMTVRVTPLAPIGCEIAGLDLEHDIAPETAAAIREAWIKYGVVVFPRAGLSEDGHLRLSRCFGDPQPAATKKLNLERNPFIMALNQDAGTPVNVYEVNGERRTGWLGWHWDQAFMPHIVRGAVLRAIEPAETGGETGFIHAGDAYDRLSPAMKERIDGLEVVYHFNGAQERNRFGYPSSLKLVERGADQAESIARYERDFPSVVHPLVITQPETGRRFLKLSPMHARQVLGMAIEESDALLAELADQLVDERYAYFHRWRKNDLVAWDNWAVIHCARGVPPGVLRRAQRTTIMGDYGLGRYFDAATNPARHTARLVD